MRAFLACGLWLCPTLSLLLAVAILVLLGVSWWTAVVAAVLLGCPVAVAWTLVADRLGRREIDRGPARRTSHE